jgi:hypothetical protein
MNKILIAVGVVALVVAGYLGLMSTINTDDGVNLGYRENTKQIAILTNATASSTGATASVVYYRNVGVSIATESASGTVKVVCSLQDTEPVWREVRSVTNTWDYIQLVDKEDGSTIDGDTGVVFANSSDTVNYAINDDNSRWCTAEISDPLTTGIVTGTTTVFFKPSDNQ